MDDLRDNDIAIFAIYTDIDLEPGLDVMKKYFGTLPDMFTNTTSLSFEFAPQKALVDLETMEVIKLESYSSAGFVSFDVDDAIAACKAL